MVHKPPEPEGAARGRGLFMEHKFLSTVASFPGPAQLSVAISAVFRAASDENLGGAWERG